MKQSGGDMGGGDMGIGGAGGADAGGGGAAAGRYGEAVFPPGQAGEGDQAILIAV